MVLFESIRTYYILKRPFKHAFEWFEARIHQMQSDNWLKDDGIDIKFTIVTILFV